MAARSARLSRPNDLDRLFLPCPEFVYLGGEEGIDDQHLGFRIGKDERYFPGGKPEIQRRRYGAKLGNGKVNLQKAMAIGQQYGNLVIFPNPLTSQGVGEAVDPLSKCPIGEDTIPAADSFLAGKQPGRLIERL